MIHSQQSRSNLRAELHIWAPVYSLALIALLARGALALGEPPTPPRLSEAQKAEVQLLVQRFEIAQLRAELARRDLLERLKALEVPGYDLDLQTLEYRSRQQPAAKPEAAPAAPAKPKGPPPEDARARVWRLWQERFADRTITWE